MLAAQEGSSQVMEVLLLHGIDINRADPKVLRSMLFTASPDIDMADLAQ